MAGVNPVRDQRQGDPSRRSAAPAWWKGPQWQAQRLRQPGWVLLPLRLFLGVTYTYASLQKLANPDFFTSGSPASVQHQMQSVAPTSPIGPLVQLSLHAGAAVGLVIALGELAVGLGALLGLKTRLAAAGGAVLALSFFLTVSWSTSPYYYGADIVFLFAWTPFISIGAAEVMALDGWIAGRPPASARGRVPAPRAEARRRSRRAVLTTGLLAVLLGGLTAGLGRLLRGSRPAGQGADGAAAGGPTSGPSRSRPTSGGSSGPHATSGPHSRSGTRAPAGMTRVSAVDALPVGQASQFHDPATGSPAWVVRTGQRSFAGFSAVCTHAGCTVGFDANSQEFVCPCHGGTYSATTGKVLGGPPPAPLAAIPVQIADGQVYVR